ncbi:hypothetical protein E8D34_14915 [Nocardioides sp. GY 10113]|uniref:hypothetical protein n=1 Tax=Nocardioides sp. GY 10113 TaxID=2569761 RepID=UPI0010A7E2B6|nr:hypothetical protein [Nocardioides sp. GY 10113]TIC83852.1 hypothetical protein E8D34_14915 [Nocardioides sp. GY 10113]
MAVVQEVGRQAQSPLALAGHLLGELERVRDERTEQREVVVVTLRPGQRRRCRLADDRGK